VDAVIRKALEKVPADRFASASELARALADPDFRYEPAGSAARAGMRGGGTRWKALAIALGATSAVLALALALTAAALRRPEPRVVSRFDVTPRPEQRLAVGESSPDFALSPDGRYIAYRGVAPGGGAQLWVRALEELEAVPLSGTEGATAMAFSPDGLTVAYEVAGAVRTVPRVGGPSVTVASAAGGPTHSVAFGPDGLLYFGRGNVIFRIPPGGGEAEALTPPESGLLRFPDVLPEGRGLLVTRIGAYPGLNRVALVEPQETGPVRDLLVATMARYSPTGHLLYTTADGTLLAAPFDLERLEVSGPAVALAQALLIHASGAAQFAVSASGALLYGSGGSASELVWVSRSGVAEPVDPAWPQAFAHPALSPDGRRLAVTIRDETSMNVWVKQLDRGPNLQLTLEGSLNGYSSWTPDGASVTFFSDRAGPSFDLLTKRSDGGTSALLELDFERALAESAWSPDGAWLLARTDRGEPGQGDVLAARRPGSDSPTPLLQSGFAELSPAVSPDGRWLAYTSNETGTDEIYVTPFPEPGGTKWVVSTGGGAEPVWSRDGRELFYRSSGGELVAVAVETEPTFSAGARTVLFSVSDYRADVNHPQYDVAPDGRRFLMIRPVTGQGTLTLVLNFDQELGSAPR
jgi:serine/threonine-protein kinase